MSLGLPVEQRLDRAPESEIERLALRLLATREHSRLELLRKIQRRGFSVDDAIPVLDRLGRDGTLDEDRLAEHYVAERVGKGFGPARICAELREKGLADASIGRHLDAVGDAWADHLAHACERRFGPGRPADLAEAAKRARFLEQRGFPADAIRRFLRLHD